MGDRDRVPSSQRPNTHTSAMEATLRPAGGTSRVSSAQRWPCWPCFCPYWYCGGCGLPMSATLTRRIGSTSGAKTSSRNAARVWALVAPQFFQPHHLAQWTLSIAHSAMRIGRLDGRRKKKKWCCRVHNKGCPAPGESWAAVAAASYDCNAGFENFVKGWSILKKNWCCQNQGKGCVGSGDMNAVQAASQGFGAGAEYGDHGAPVAIDSLGTR